MSKYGSTSNQIQQLSGYLIDNSLDSSERREDTDFFSRYLFPIIAEVNRSIPAPMPLLYFQYIILYLQLFFGSYFIFHHETIFSEDFLTFCKVIFFGMVGDRGSLTLFSILLFVINCISFLFIVIILTDYRNNHKFKVWQLNVLRMWHGLLFTYFIFPNIFFLSYSISSLYIDFKWTLILLFIASLLSITYTIFHVLFLSNLLNQSPFLFHMFSFHWRPPELLFLFIICTIPYAVDGIVPKATSGFRYFPPILTIIASAYIVYNMYYLPFTYLFTNVAWISLAAAMVVNSIFSIIHNIKGVNINKYVELFVPMGVLLISFPITYPLLSIRRKNIKKSLMYETAFPEGDPNNEELKQSYLSTLNINRKRQAFTILQVGIEEGADLFLDWSLSKYIFDNFEDDGDILLFLTWTISFFPYETSTLLRTFIHSISKMKKLSIRNRSLLYQLHRLHIFRQSSSMAEANSDLMLIRKMTDRCTSDFCQVWKKFSTSDFNISHDFYENLTETRRSTEATWAEFLDKYPNDARLVNEYARFLLDCRCQFRESIHYHQRAKSIEKGTRLQNDRMFHRFVQMFPFYLKKGIVDTSGKLQKKHYQQQQIQQIQQLQQQQQDYSIPNVMQNDSSLEDSSNDVELVEAEQFIPHAQLRFAFERAVNEIESPVLRKVIVTEAVSLLIAVAYFILIAMMLTHMFDEKRYLFSYLSSINKIVDTYEMITPRITKMWSSYFYGNITNETELEIFGPSVTEIPSYLNVDSTDSQIIFNLSVTGLNYLDDFSNDLYRSGSTRGYRIFNITRLISDTQLYSAICVPNENVLYVNDQYITIDFLWRSLFLTSSRFMSNVGFDDSIETTTSLCEAYTKNFMLANALTLISMNVSSTFSYECQLLKRCNASHFTENEPGVSVQSSPRNCPSPPILIGDPIEENVPNEVEEYSDNTLLNFLIAFTPFLILAIVFPSTIFLSTGFSTEKVEVTKQLQTFSKQECLDAAEVIIKKDEDSDIDDDSELPQEVKKKNYIATYVINAFCVLAVVVLLLIQLIMGSVYSKKLNIIIEHSTLVSCLGNSIITAAHDSLLYVFLNEATKDKKFDINFINTTFLKGHIKSSLRFISLITNMLKRGYTGIPSADGYIKEIDLIFDEEKCSIDSKSEYIIDTYKCMSFAKILNYFYESIENISNSVDSYSINSTESLLFGKLIETRLALGFLELTKQYEETFNSRIRSFNLIIWICFLIGLVFVILSLGIELFLVAISNQDLITFKCLILRVDPVVFASNPQALSLLYGRKNLVDTRIISASHSVFYTSNDAMMSLNQEGIIESLNPAASEIFGYTPEQMLGQNIKLLINPEIKNNNQLFYTIQLMKSGQCSLISESVYAGSRDDETILPLRVTLIGFSSNDRVAGSFAIICRDQTEEEELRVKVESAQKESEELLLQFVPQEMLSKLNKEEPEIGFAVPSCSIAIINIVQFSSYIKSVEPEELLSNLSKLFNSFDKILSSIPTVTKIKIVGDVYIAAAGLFNPEILPSLHATDLIGFGLKTLDSIEEVNIQLNSSLQIRIGIHSGGPITAGVFGPEKHMFEIVGSPVDACQKLEKNCIPGTINISNDTFVLLPPGRYHTEEHEVLDLEGTESQMTYTLQPGHVSASPTNNVMYTPPTLELLLGGSNSQSSIVMDIMSPFTEDDGNNAQGSFVMPSLASLIDPQNEPQ